MNKLKDNDDKRNIGLDLFRYVLALIIFLFHSNMHINCSYSIFTPFISMGAIAMTAFFMLSGYSLYLSNGRKQLLSILEIKQFYLKRFITIYPIYYLVAFLYIVMMSFIEHSQMLVQHLLIIPIDLLGLQSIFEGSFDFSHHGGTWFISCISICYLFYPYIQHITNQLNEQSKLFLITLFVFILLLSPIIQITMKWGSIYANPFFRLMEFFIGILIANINDKSQNSLIKIFQTKYSLVLACVFLFLGVSLCRKFQFYPENYMLYSWIALPMFVVIILSLGKNRIHFVFGKNVIKYLSSLSYVFFLAQFLVWRPYIYICQTKGYADNTLRIIVSLSLCTIIAIVMHECFEKPVTKYLKRKILI